MGTSVETRCRRRLVRRTRPRDPVVHAPRGALRGSLRAKPDRPDPRFHPGFGLFGRRDLAAHWYLACAALDPGASDGGRKSQGRCGSSKTGEQNDRRVNRSRLARTGWYTILLARKPSERLSA